MKEIKDLSTDKYQELEKEIAEYFMKLKEKIDEANIIKYNNNDNNEQSYGEGNRGIGVDDGDILYFKNDVELRYIMEKGINDQNFGTEGVISKPKIKTQT